MQTAGWILIVAGVGLMCGLMAVDVSQLASWGQATTPTFIGGAMAHLSAVIAAAVGGKLLPSDPLPGGRRGTDPPKKEE